MPATVPPAPSFTPLLVNTIIHGVKRKVATRRPPTRRMRVRLLCRDSLPVPATSFGTVLYAEVSYETDPISRAVRPGIPANGLRPLQSARRRYGWGAAYCLHRPGIQRDHLCSWRAGE